MSRIYWDSCVAIYRVENVAHWAMTLAQWLAAQDAGAALCISELTRMECRLAPLRAGNAELLARYDDFFARPDLSTVDLSRAVFERATALRDAHRLKTPDAALHLAAAIESRCTQFWTNDRRLAAAAAGYLEVHALSA